MSDDLKATAERYLALRDAVAAWKLVTQFTGTHRTCDCAACRKLQEMSDVPTCVELPSEIILQSANIPKTRGELQEFLCDAIEAVLGVDDTRGGNGFTCDTLLRCLDEIVNNDGRRERFDEFIKEIE
jgi:hypothetical protein